MKSYAFRALNADGELARGILEARNMAELEQGLRERNLELINASARFGLQRPLQRIPRSALIEFCFHLEQLLEAGLPPCESLASLAETCRHAGLHRNIVSLHAQISGGLPISAAAALQPQLFSRTAVALLRAGEETGHLAAAIAEISQLLEHEQEFARYRQRLAIYPSILAGLMLLITLLTLTQLVPQLEQLFRSGGLELPWQTRLLVALADFTIDYGWQLLAIVTALLGTALGLLHHSSALRRRRDHVLLQLPLVGELLVKIALARIAGVLAGLYGAGISIVDAIELAANTATNLSLRQAMVEVRQHILHGQPLAAAFARNDLFPPLLKNMLAVGEQSGRLEQTLSKIATLYRRDIDFALKRLQAMLEPALTLTLGLFLLWLASATLGPIYELVTSLPG